MKIATVTLDLVLPIQFIKEVVSVIESEPDSNQKWRGQIDSGGSEKQTGSNQCIVTCAKKEAIDEKDLLSISIKNIKFKFSDTRLSCFIRKTEKCTSDLEEFVEKENINQQDLLDNNTQSVQSEEKIIKVKRGRKKKAEIDQPIQSVNLDNFEKTDNGKRYGLRGVKISENIMKAVKGLEYNITGKDETSVAKESNNGVISISPLHEINPDENMEDLESETEACIDSGEEDDDDFIPSNDEDYGSSRKRKKLKYVKTVSGKNVIRPRKNRKIDLGDIPKVERRKQKLERNASCKYCGKLFADYTGVDFHVKKYHTKEKDYEDYIEKMVLLKIMKCEMCGEELPDRLALQVHENKQHRKSSEAKCFRCGKMYKNVNSLRNHVRCVHFVKGQPNLCHLCPAKFKWRVTLRQHIEEIHEGKMTSVCKICGKHFSRDSLMKRHQRIHGIDQSKRLVCNKCGKGFWYECNLQRHIQCVHGEQQEMFHCSYCGKGFHSKYGMMTHVQQVHFNLYPFKCSNCNSGFTSKKILKDHLAKVHKLTNISIHVNKNSRFKYGRKTEDLFFCSYCGSSFCYKAKLVDHMHTTHAEEFPYKCTHCNQGFLERAFLSHHLQKAHGESDVNIPVAKIKETNDENNSNIAKFVTLNFGSGDTEVYTQDNSKQTKDELYIDTESPEEISLPTGSTDNDSSSVLFEVSTGMGTVQYVIKQPNDGGPTVLPKELADILLAAESVGNYEAELYSENNITDQETVTVVSGDVEEQVQVISSNMVEKNGVEPVHNLCDVSECSSTVEQNDTLSSTILEQVEVDNSQKIILIDNSEINGDKTVIGDISQVETNVEIS